MCATGKVNIQNLNHRQFANLGSSLRAQLGNAYERIAEGSNYRKNENNLYWPNHGNDLYLSGTGFFMNSISIFSHYGLIIVLDKDRRALFSTKCIATSIH